MSPTLSPTAPEQDNWTGLEHLVAPLQRYLHRRCACSHDVQDALQETLLRAARYRKQGLEPDRVRAWAIGIAANVVRDQGKRRGRAPSVGHEDKVFAQFCGRELDPAERDERAPLRVMDRWFEMDLLVQHLGQALADLSEPDRLVLHCYYSGEGSTQEAAQLLRTSQSLVKVRLFRARQRVRRKMELSLARAGRQGRLLREFETAS